MITEQEILFELAPEQIYQKLQITPELKLAENITINYFGDITKLPSIKNNNSPSKKYIPKIKSNFTSNPLLFTKYKDIYIGGISLYNNTREKFGLNKFSDDSFYLGQWKRNMKHGIGFLKINNNISYIGAFKKNQLNGFGMLYYKNENILYFGNFNDGKFIDGLCYNQNKGTFYRGKINEGKKNDKFCTFFEINNGHLFIGEVKDDNFIKGYLGLCEISEENVEGAEDEEDEIINFKLQKIIYYDKTNKDNIIFIHYYSFTPDFYKKIQDFMNNVFQADFNLKDQTEGIIEYFNSLENCVNEKEYCDDINKYNPYDNEENLEKFFLRDYNEYCERFETGQEVFDMENYDDILGPPEINKDEDNENEV